MNLHKLYLQPAFQGQGQGRRVLERLRLIAIGLGALQMQLRVNKRNLNAIAFYERAGFKMTQALETEIGQGYVMDDYVMSLVMAKG